MKRQHWRIFLVAMVMISGLQIETLWCQSSQEHSVLFDETTNKITSAVYSASQKQAIYAYNVANFSTPGFRPILTEEDRRYLNSVLPDGGSGKDIMLEYFMSQMTVNRSRHSALTKLFSTKLGIMRQVATLGKR